MDALAAEAFLNAEHTVCGLRMRPLSLGHAFTLEAVGSPLYAGQRGTESDLRLAAWLCSREPFAQLKCSGLKHSLWKWASAKLDFETETARWKNYVSDYCAPPQLWRKAQAEGVETSKVPSSIATAVRLMQMGMSEREAWSTPVGIASWYEAASFEQQNGAHLDIVTDSERIAIFRHKAQQAAQQENTANG